MNDRARFGMRYAGWVATLAIGCLLFAGSARDARAADTPARSARLSFTQGNVTVDQVDNTGSTEAQLNMPLAQGVRLTTGADGQAEVEFEDGSVVRLTPNSSLALTGMTADGSGNFQTNLTLGYGLAYAELRSADKFAYGIDAGGTVISPVTNTTVRIEMDKPPAAISVLDGTAQVERSGSAGGGSYRTNVNAGETLTGDADNPGRYRLAKDIPQNSWDQWNDDRDQAAAQEASDQTAVRDKYAGEAGYGWSDLDANGSWYDVPGEGEVWQPNVAMDPAFDPYGYGSWVWYPGMGYVWASGYNWGWTPFRCGTWSYWNGFGWGWLPGNGCGYGGWGFGRGYGYGYGGGGGGGYVINVTRPPQNYHFRPVPVHSPGGVHPIKVGRPVVPNPGQMRPVRGPRTIAGRTVQPVKPVLTPGATGTARPGGTGGGALHRDFPVDSVNHRPVLGRPANPAATAPNVHPGTVHPITPRTGIEGREAPMRPTRPEPSQSAPQQARPQPEQTRPVTPSQPVPRNVSPPVQRSSPPVQQPRYTAPAQPRYTPPAQPRYTPPPQPRYSPPPQQPHYSPPPSAPARSSGPAPVQRK